MRYVIEPMHLGDIDQVQVIENQSFSAPWSAQAYEHDLRKNKLAHYVVLRELDDGGRSPAAEAPPLATPARSLHLLRRLLQRLSRRPNTPPTHTEGPLLGFAGIWLMVDEAHLVTIAVAPGQRSKGLGELLLVSMIDLSCIRGAARMTLEVRVSNHVAQSLYRKYGFKNEGVRRRYYSDNNEDALIMTTDVLTSARYQQTYQVLKRELLARIRVSFRMI